MIDLRYLWVTLCATLFYACSPAVNYHSPHSFNTGHEIATRTGEASTTAEATKKSGVQVFSSQDLVQKKTEKAHTKNARVETTLQAKADDPEMLKTGEELFLVQCVACHGSRGSGVVGPDLNDQHFIYGSDLQSIYEIISQGSEKGMPGWKHILSVDQLRALAIFTKHLSTPLP